MKEGYIQSIDFGDFTKGGREQTAVKTNRDPGTADTSSLVLGQGKPLAQKAYPAPQTAENAERHGERTAQDAEKLPLAGQPQSEKRGNNPVDATTGQAAADPNQPKESPSRSAQDDPSLDYMVREVFGTYEPWHPGKMTIENKYGYEFIDTPQEKVRKRAEIRAEIPPEKQERLRKIVHGYNSVQGLTEEEWKVLEVESWPYLDT
jgi:hypothetical protein